MRLLENAAVLTKSDALRLKEQMKSKRKCKVTITKKKTPAYMKNLSRFRNSTYFYEIKCYV